MLTIFITHDVAMRVLAKDIRANCPADYTSKQKQRRITTEIESSLRGLRSGALLLNTGAKLYPPQPRWKDELSDKYMLSGYAADGSDVLAYNDVTEIVKPINTMTPDELMEEIKANRAYWEIYYTADLKTLRDAVALIRYRKIMQKGGD